MNCITLYRARRADKAYGAMDASIPHDLPIKLTCINSEKSFSIVKQLPQPNKKGRALDHEYGDRQTWPAHSSLEGKLHHR